jgi:hypothetical protein
MLLLSSEFYLKTAHLQCVDVVAIRRNYIRRDIRCEIYMDMAQDRDQWRALVNTVLNLRIP